MDRLDVDQRRPHGRNRGGWSMLRGAAVVTLLALSLLSVQLVVARSGAVFTSARSTAGSATSGRIFPGHRVTPAFTIADSSSGSVVDRSSAIGYQGDGRWTAMHAWPVAFDGTKLVDLTLNHPLPAGLSVSGAQLAVTLSSDVAGGTACWYADIVRVSTGATVSSHGSAGSPLACVTGTTFVRTVVPLAAITGSDLANDLLVRIHGRSSAGAAARFDEVTISGSTAYAAFTLYPVLTRDVFTGGVETLPWQLAGE
jgi:hypothetical protein